MLLDRSVGQIFSRKEVRSGLHRGVQLNDRDRGPQPNDRARGLQPDDKAHGSSEEIQDLTPNDTA